jgi:prenyltransferase beta subunit
MIRLRKREAILAAAAGLTFLFAVWLYWYLRPDTWHYYTDEISVRQLAKDVTPRLVLWESAKPVSNTIERIGRETAPAISPDGVSMVFSRMTAAGNTDLFIARWNGRAWKESAPLRALNSCFNETEPSFSADGKHLFFSTDRPGGPGGFDIWVSRWDGAEFAWPLPLTVMVNSKFDETGPHQRRNNGALFFASDRPREPLSKEEMDLPSKDLRARFPSRDFDLFMAQAFPAGVTNVEVERAQSMLYSLRECALGDVAVMEKLGGSRSSEAAVDRALGWLAHNQETNGSWSITRQGGQGGHDVAATAFGLLTFLGRGEQPNRPGKYQAVVARGLHWLLTQQDPLTGDMRGRNPPSNGMYDHSIASLALAEAYGLTKDENLYGPAQGAIDFLVDSQNEKDGGWRYHPKQEGDMSVSGWAIMAIKSAELSGLHVPAGTLAGIRKWLMKVSGGRDGGIYGYQNGGHVSDAMAATGYFCSQLMGLSPNTLRAFETTASLSKPGLSLDDVYFAYYGTLCAYQNQGPFWRGWREKIHAKFIAEQQPEGSWKVSGSHGSSMGKGIATSLVALSLQAHYRYTPMYGLGYEPPTNRACLSRLSMDEVPAMPHYEMAKRLTLLNSSRNDRDVCITEHGDFLYFASDRHGGIGGLDLYRCRFGGDEPLAPVLLGPEINTILDERSPALRLAGFELLFVGSRKNDASGTEAVLNSSVSRRVYARHSYTQLPAIGWMLTMFPLRLALLGATLLGLAWVSLRQRRAASGSVSLPRRLLTASLLLLLVVCMVSIACTVRNTVWCYYTDDQGIRRDAVGTDARLVLWEDPHPSPGDWSAISNRVSLRFTEDEAVAAFTVRSPESTNELNMTAVWDGRRWGNIQKARTDIAVKAVSTRAGGYDYLSAEKRGGFGKDDLYCRRVLDGDKAKDENLGLEINSPVNDRDPAVRMEGFSLLFNTDRTGKTDTGEALFETTSREVTGMLDLSRWYSLMSLLGRMKWWLMALVTAAILLIYLLRHWRDMTTLLHKCLAASAIVHLLLLLLTGFWVLSTEISESLEPKSMEVSINADALAKEKLALDMQERVTEMPPAPATVIAAPLEQALPVPEFTPPKTATADPVVTRTSEESFVTRVTPSRAAAEQALKLTAVQKVDNLPVMKLPELEIVLDVPEATQEDRQAARETFEPVPVQEALLLESRKLEKQMSKPVVRVIAAQEVSADRSATNSTGSATVRDTGGSLVIASAGTESKGALPAMSGMGDITGLMAMGEGPGKTLKLDAPGKLDVPESADGISLSTEVVKNRGKLSMETIEGLGGSGSTEKAIGRALDWFSKHQEADGRWNIKRFGGQANHDVATTSLILLCYYGWGAKQTEQGPYQETVRKALDWLVAQIKPDGRFYPDGLGNGMYDQGMATIALCEAYGLTKEKRLHDAATNAVSFIIAAQDRNSGGWRYQPRSGSDTSVFGWQYMGLRSAQLAGLTDMAESISNCLVRADKWLDAVGGGQHGGVYGYTQKGGSQGAMLATGMFCRQLAKVPPTDPRMAEGAQFMKVNPLSPNLDYYYLYYGTLSMYQHQGVIWDEWNDRMKKILLEQQRNGGDEEGSWDPKGTHGNEMGRAVVTALATLSLEVYYRILPIYGYRPGEK